jgi:hypothetical protein
VELLISRFKYLNIVLCLVNFIMLIGLKIISSISFDIVYGINTLNIIKEVGFPDEKYLLFGVNDGQNIWENDLSRLYIIDQF